MTTSIDALHERGARYGPQTMCEAGGPANATILERLREGPVPRRTPSVRAVGGRGSFNEG